MQLFKRTAILMIFFWSLALENALAQSVSQNIVALQYYFDIDPGVGVTGNGAILTITPTDSLDKSFNLPFSNLPSGIHYLYIRLLDDSGHWSSTERRMFFVNNPSNTSQIKAYQYYFDTDPGTGITGNGAVQSIPTSDSLSALINCTISSGLAPGLHQLYLRVQGDNNVWSIAERRLVFIGVSPSQKIETLEYYFDSDPGAGLANEIVISPSKDSLNQIYAMYLPVLPPGIHYLYVRAKDQEGRWSIIERDTLTAIAGIAASTIQAEGHGMLCANDSLKLFTTPVAGIAYQWLLNSNAIPGATNHFYYANTIGNYSLISINGVSSDTSNVLNIQQGVTVIPSIGISGGTPTPVCYGTNVTFNAIPLSAGINPHYRWRVNGIAQPLDSTFFSTTSLQNNDVVTCTLLADNPCQSIDSVTSSGISVSIVVVDSAGPISGATSIVACVYQNNISYSVPAIANASSYTWTLPSGASIITNLANSIVVNYSPYSQSGVVSVAGINNSCIGVASDLAINFKPIPVGQICYADVDTLSQKTELYWQKATESYVDGYVIFREIPYQSGNYQNIDTVSAIAFSSYLDNDTTIHPDLHPESYKLAILDSCGNIGDISSAFQHQTIRLYGNIELGGIAKLYWTDYVGINDTARYYKILRDTSGNGPFEMIGTTPSHTIRNFTDITSGSYPNCRYRVDLMADINCSPGMRLLANKSTTRSNIRNRSGLIVSSGCCDLMSTDDGLTNIRIYPNPAVGKLFIKNLSPSIKYTVSLFDVLGQLIYESDLSSEEEFMLATNQFSNGLYVLKITAKERSRTIKISLE